MTPTALLLVTETTPEAWRLLSERYHLLPAHGPEAQRAVAAAHGPDIRGIVTRGAIPIGAALMDSLPNLGIIASSGVGYEGVDLDAARARGISVTHGRAVNADTVADQAMTLLLAAIRRVPENDARVRRGQARDMSELLPQPSGKRVGIIGFGEIGQRIARRCAGFDMPVAYFARRPVEGTALPRAESVRDLAARSDILIAAVPGGAATYHLVDDAVLAALGPGGYFVNVGRGSVADTGAIIRALDSGLLAGAGLDVIEGEPDVPEALRRQPHAVFSPHIGGLSPEATARSSRLLRRNLDAHFANQPLATPVPA